MKLSNKVLEFVICEVAGEDVIPLVKALKTKKNVSEFKLAEAIKEEVNAWIGLKRGLSVRTLNSIMCVMINVYALILNSLLILSLNALSAVN